jgi:hypothetical protein
MLRAALIGFKPTKPSAISKPPLPLDTVFKEEVL